MPHLRRTLLTAITLAMSLTWAGNAMAQGRKVRPQATGIEVPRPDLTCGIHAYFLHRRDRSYPYAREEIDTKYTGVGYWDWEPPKVYFSVNNSSATAASGAFYSRFRVVQNGVEKTAQALGLPRASSILIEGIGPVQTWDSREFELQLTRDVPTTWSAGTYGENHGYLDTFTVSAVADVGATGDIATTVEEANETNNGCTSTFYIRHYGTSGQIR